eukprot:gnl/TRDRNA2_/TRDRNA2_35063_c0_seq1.p1 gnl/TRDRNA2_/TRDRNA2_35063_c0~~gnl/TRDRNA2_/TRDRNA2_35063_c0_seq1.p1  ORF type:complete len:392 (+),score=64.72 gnl/TRDRNA2_/TRDRNA2_35063_c0_seq1:52-1227(+)
MAEAETAHVSAEGGDGAETPAAAGADATAKGAVDEKAAADPKPAEGQAAPAEKQAAPAAAAPAADQTVKIEEKIVVEKVSPPTSPSGVAERGADGRHPARYLATAPRRMKAGQRWDGRLKGLSLQEYRELKWGTEGGWRTTQRNGPSWTVRGKNEMTRSRSAGAPVDLVGDVSKAIDYTKSSFPAWTMSGGCPVTEYEKSLGPAEYTILSTMNTGKHPTLSKKSGMAYSWGTQQLERPPRWKNTNPGPGNYEDGAFKKSSLRPSPLKYTIQGREAWAGRAEAPGPDPGTYTYEKVMKNGKITCPRYTMQGKTEPLDPPLGARQVEAPGPATYNPPGTAQCKNQYCSATRPPKFTIGLDPKNTSNGGDRGVTAHIFWADRIHKERKEAGAYA